MNSTTKGVIIFIVILLIWGGGFVVYYFYDHQSPAPVQTISTTAIETSSTTKPTMPPEELVYVQTLQYYDASLIASVNTIISLLANPLVTSQAWADSIAIPVGNVLGLYNVIKQIPTSSNITVQLHNYYVNNVVGNYYVAVQFITTAITEGNTDSLRYANAYIEAGTQARTQFFSQLNEYIDSYN